MAEYNSNDEHSADEMPNAKPLFAAIATATANPIIPVKIAKPAEIVEADENVPVVVAPTKKVKSTFASIITGGRSPDPTDLCQPHPLTEEQSNQNATDHPEPSPVIDLDTKAFKRKRRIEFITKPLFPVASKGTTIAPNEESLDDDGDVCGDSNNAKKFGDTACRADDSVTATKNNSLYANFKHSHTEFVSAITAASNNEMTDDAHTTNAATVEDDIGGSNQGEQNVKQKNEISDLRTIIDSKLKFLCEGRPDISAVQAIMIQLEVSLCLIQMNSINI